MGTDNPNPNAVLELVSENQNQGFLVPRLSTQQRNASSFISKLTDQDNGLMVFDIDEGNFYYWYAGMWRVGGITNTMTPKSTVWYVSDVIPSNSQGENGDFYVHQPTSDLYRKQNGVFTLIGSLKKAEGSYSAGNGISITPQNEIINTGDLDAANELQDLSLSGTTLSLSGSSSTVDLSVVQDGTGTDGQKLSSSKTGNDVSISIDNGNTTIFSVADKDDDAHNEKITSASLTAGDILRIQEASTSHDIDMSGFQKKALPENQILIGNAANIATPVSISGDITLNSDGTMTITLDAVTTEKIINNAITTAKIANAAVTKDKINADVAGNGIGQNTDRSLEVKVAGGGLQITTDQLQLSNKGDGQILIGDGTQVNARTVAGDATVAHTGTATVTGLQGRPVSTTAPSNNQVLAWNGSAWAPKTPTGAGAGTGLWFSGSSLPTASIPLGANTGDYYFHTGTKMVYRKDGLWTELGRWVLPSGDQVSGATITSISTPTLYIGTGSPINGTTDNAQPGDFYFDTSDGVKGKLYIKKNNNDWHNF